MLTLKRLYSETELFEEITFQPGLNLILGSYSDKGIGKEGENGIGKSSIIRLIDFAFLSTSAKTIFKDRKYSFLTGNTFTLEFILDDTIYSIKRIFDKDYTIWFSENQNGYIEYEESELKEILGNKFFMSDDYIGIVEPIWFRNLIHFFIKDDLNHHLRQDPINFFNSKKSKLLVQYYNFFLLGIPNESLHEFDVVNIEIKEKKKEQKGLENRIFVDTGKEIKQYKSELHEMQKRVDKLSYITNNYQFEEHLKDKEEELIKLSGDINDKIKTKNKLNKELLEYNLSTKLNLNADIEKTRKVYSQVDEDLAVFIKKSMTEILQFRKVITENRKTFLSKRIFEIKNSLHTISNEVSELEQKRTSIYKSLDEIKALDELKHSYQDLIEEKSQLDKNGVLLAKIQEIEVEISNLSTNLSEHNTEILNTIKDSNSIIENIRNIYFDILEKVIFIDESIEGAKFEIDARTNKTSPVIFELDVPKSESLGNNRFTFLAYDMTVFFHLISNKRNLPEFLVHDGVYHEIEIKKQINILNYIYSQSLMHPEFQYIFTMNENQLKVTDEEAKLVGNYNFDIEAIKIAHLENFEGKMFFKKSF